MVSAYGRGQTDKHTDARDHNTFCVVYDSRENVITTSLLRKSLSGLSCLSYLAVAEAKDESYKNALQPQNDISVRLLSGIC